MKVSTGTQYCVFHGATVQNIRAAAHGVHEGAVTFEAATDVVKTKSVPRFKEQRQEEEVSWWGHEERGNHEHRGGRGGGQRGLK